MRKVKLAGGFTLVETMVVVFIFLVIISAVFTVLGAGRNTWLSGTTYIEVGQELRKAKEWIMKELEQGRYFTVAITNGNIIDFQIPLNIAENGSITWQAIRYSIGGLGNRQLLRTVGAEVRVLANNIDSVTFVIDGGNPRLINVAITASKQNVRGETINSDLGLDIKFRN